MEELLSGKEQIDKQSIEVSSNKKGGILCFNRSKSWYE